METFELKVTFEAVGCANCAMQFATPTLFLKERRADHGTFYCPQGHTNYFPGKSEVEKLKDQLAEQEKSTNYFSRRLDTVYAEKQHVEHKLRAQKGQVTRIKNRVANGICPCCSRHFVNVERHIKNQHPDFATKDGADANTTEK